MAEIIIKIDNELLNRIKYFCEVYLEPNAHTMSYDLMRSVQNGTLLPKGHGRLIDADKLKKYKYYDSNRFENAVAVAQIDWANTIIEADKENIFAKAEESAVVSQPKIGKWLNGELIPNDITGHWYAECSECGKVRIVDNYCPNCGARMEIEE